MFTKPPPGADTEPAKGPGRPRVHKDAAASAQAHRERMAQKSRDQHQAVAEVGDIPAVADPERRERCRLDLYQYLVTYFPDSTGLCPFSDDHKAFIARLQKTILEGGREIDCVYRGFAKTTIGENAVLWAASYGHKRFIFLLGADKDAAQDNLESIKGELEGNELLAADFPEICHPIAKLEGKAQRCHSQTHKGKKTNCAWTKQRIVLPRIEGSKASGCCIRTKSLLSCNRGAKHKWEGRQIRPDFVFVDDPQTDESAQSPVQVKKRLNKLYKTVLKLAGHRSSLSCFIAATVIAKYDFADQLLDKKLHPSWAGYRVAMLKSWAEGEAHEKLWLGEYSRIRLDFDREDPDDRKRARVRATEYYKENRAVMDAGCVVSWAHCYSEEEDEISAEQHAYNILIDDGQEVFESECQNNPQEQSGDFDQVTAAALVKKTSGYKRGTIPAEAEHLTAFVDVQGKCLYWMVVAWKTDFTGWIIDYGIWPEQPRKYVTLRQIRKTLKTRYRGTDTEGAQFAGLTELVAYLLEKRWRVDAGGDMQIDKLLVDSGYNADTVKSYTRAAKQGKRVQPSKGYGIKAKERPISEWKATTGCKRGREWIESKPKKSRTVLVNYDSNYWETQIAEGLSLPIGTRCAIALPDEQGQQMLAEQLTAKTATWVETIQRKIFEWSDIPNRDNHFGDCLKGCGVVASMLGCLRPGQEKKKKKKKKRNVRFS